MDYDAQLKVQAYLDGELGEAESREVANLLARDQDATLLLGELRMTRQVLRGAESGIKLPESREFFWSKVSREIERMEAVSAREPAAKVSAWAAWRRFLLPAGAVASLALAILFIGSQIGIFQTANGPEFETAIADPGALVYRDYARKTTLVWFSYPAENGVAARDTSDTVPTQ
jgi:anti-sigma factor RsiW